MIKHFSDLRPAWRFAILLCFAMLFSLLVRDSAPVFNIILLCAGGTVVAYHFVTCPEEFNDAERLGVGLFIAGMIMSTPAIWLDHTPFDDWSLNVGRGGGLLFLYAVIRRRVHDKEARKIFSRDRMQ